MQAARIPKRVPVGTKYVIEGKAQGAGQVHVFSRYLVFPDGRCFDLPSDGSPAPAPARRRGFGRSRAH
jgi:predicted component of type VI protein secretion system